MSQAGVKEYFQIACSMRVSRSISKLNVGDVGGLGGEVVKGAEGA